MNVLDTIINFFFLFFIYQYWQWHPPFALNWVKNYFTHTHDKNQRKAASETVKLKVGPCEVSFSFFQGLGSVSVRGVVGPAVMCF